MVQVTWRACPQTGGPCPRDPRRQQSPGSEDFADAADGAALTDALTKRYPDNGMLIAAQIGAKVVTGEMSWG